MGGEGRGGEGRGGEGRDRTGQSTFKGYTVEILGSRELSCHIDTTTDESFSEDMVKNSLKLGIKLEIV